MARVAQGSACLSAWILWALAVVPLPAYAVDPDSQIDWQSRNETYNELTGEFAILYSGLLGFEKYGIHVDTTTMVVERGQTIEAAYRKNNLFDGPGVPKQLDVLVCQFNPGVCTVTPGANGLNAADDARTKWNIQAGAKLVVPNVQLESFVVYKTYKKKARDTWAKIVVDDRHGCESYDARCKLIVRNVNRYIDITDRTEGEVRVPTKAWRGEIPMHASQAAEVLPKRPDIEWGWVSLFAPTKIGVPATAWNDEIPVDHGVATTLQRVPPAGSWAVGDYSGVVEPAAQAHRFRALSSGELFGANGSVFDREESARQIFFPIGLASSSPRPALIAGAAENEKTGALAKYLAEMRSLMTGLKNDAASAPAPDRVELLRVDVETVKPRPPIASASSPNPSLAAAIRLNRDFSARVLPAAQFHPNSTTPTNATPVTPETAAQNRQHLLNRVQDPIATDKSVLVIPKGSDRPVVVVMDYLAEVHHCLLGNVVDLDELAQRKGLGPTVQAAMQAKVPHCGELAPAQIPDHGTHVIGLISTRVDSQIGPGINPSASVFALAAQSDRVEHNGLEMSRWITRATDQTIAGRGANVINMSVGYDPRDVQGPTDPAVVAVSDLREAMLFVIAVGNDGKPLNRNNVCGLPLVCADLPNVLTVGALNFDDHSPALWADGKWKSNYGDIVDIAAPGQDVVSSIRQNHAGAMSGTSQAAPVVAGAASLLYMKSSNLRPWEVRQRLVYTATLYPNLYGVLFGGELNIRTALKFNVDIITFTDEKTKRPTTYETEVKGPGGDIKFLDLEHDIQVPTRFNDIRRLYTQDKLGYWILYRVEYEAKRQPVLRRYKVSPVEPSEVLTFTASDSSIHSVKLADLRDYIAGMQP